VFYPIRNALDSRQLARVVNEYNGELAALADICSSIASECLEKLPDTLRGEDDVRQAVRTSARTIHACVQLAKDSRYAVIASMLAVPTAMQACLSCCTAHLTHPIYQAWL
jgi:hypothetical protein